MWTYCEADSGQCVRQWVVLSVLYWLAAGEEECGWESRRSQIPVGSLPPAIVQSATGAGRHHSSPLSQLLEVDLQPIAAARLSPATGRFTLLYRDRGGRADNGTAGGYRHSLRQYNQSWSRPFWDCQLGGWVFGYIHTHHRVKLGVYYSLERADLDSCSEGLADLFRGSPRCDPASTKCVSEEGGLFSCLCLPGYLPLSVNLSELPGTADIYRCIPNCGYETNCSEQPHLFLKSFVICVQIIAMSITILTGVVIFNRRKCKPVATGMWTILETLLFGILLLYGSMLPLSFKPTMENCIVVRWIRELGFIICYGAIILKLYRILMEFRTRKAHRWIVKDKELLKYLLGMVGIMLAYLTAWTATNLNFIEEGFTIVTFGMTPSGEYFQTCKPLWWDYVTQAGEMVILIVGLQLGLAARNAAGEFAELRYLLLAVLMEALVSSVYYISHALTWRSLHPNHAYIAAFLRCHLTVTFVLGLTFIPLLGYVEKPVRDSRHHLTHEPSDAYKPSSDGVFADIDITEVNIAEMNPEEIRAELKRLYTQLEVLRNKSICHNNPHISKRRGGRKVAHRRFSLQKKGSRDKFSVGCQALQAKRREEAEASRTPEDSVCSIDAPSNIYGDGPSTYSELGGFPTPTSTRRN